MSMPTHGLTSSFNSSSGEPATCGFPNRLIKKFPALVNKRRNSFSLIVKIFLSLETIKKGRPAANGRSYHKDNTLESRLQ